MPQLTDNIVHKEDYNQLKYEMMLSFVYHKFVPWQPKTSKDCHASIHNKDL